MSDFFGAGLGTVANVLSAFFRATADILAALGGPVCAFGRNRNRTLAHVFAGATSAFADRFAGFDGMCVLHVMAGSFATTPDVAGSGFGFITRMRLLGRTHCGRFVRAWLRTRRRSRILRRGKSAQREQKSSLHNPTFHVVLPTESWMIGCSKAAPRPPASVHSVGQ